MINKDLSKTRNLLTLALILSIGTWFVPDMLFPNSHFQSETWPLHARVHIGGAAFVNLTYILIGIWMIWRTKVNVKQMMKWVATLILTWNLVFAVFTSTILPFFMLEPGDIMVSWDLSLQGSNHDNVGIEGLGFFLAGIPSLLLATVLWRLRK